MFLKPFYIQNRLLIGTSIVVLMLLPLLISASCQGTTVTSDAPQQVPPSNHISGPQSVIVILARFKDVANTKTREEVSNLVFGELNNYFKKVSYGNAWLTGNVTSQWYQLSRSRSYYGAGMASSERATDLIVDAVRATDREVNYMNYEYIMIVYAGDDQDRSLNPNDITSGGAYRNGYPVSTGEGRLGFGVTWLAEMDPIGPYARYLACNFKLPNLLNPKNPVADNYVAEWDLMGHGFWANNGSTPAELTSWCRIRLGWMNDSRIVEINTTESRTLDIEPLETQTQGVKVVKLPISKYTYYLIEVRAKIDYDLHLPDEGVLVLYVDEMHEEGGGIVRIVDSTPLTPTLNDAPFKVGGVFENRTGNIAVEVVSASNSSYRVSIDLTGRMSLAYLTVDIPYNEINEIQVKIDGADLTPDARNRVQKLVKIGAHLIEVPSPVQLGEGSRAVFNGWTDGDLTNPRTISVNENATMTATYKLQNFLKVSSAFGSPEGSGWYDANTIATFSVVDVIDNNNETRRVFLSWNGDSNTLSPASQIEMNGPKTVSADWKTQYAVEFTSLGLKNGTTIELIINGRNESHAVPFSHIEWLDEGSELTFQVRPESFSSGMDTYRLEEWTRKDGNNVTSPYILAQPEMLTAVYGLKRPFELPSSQSSSSISVTFWTLYEATASKTLNSLVKYPSLLKIFMVTTYPFFAVADFAHKLYLTFSFVSVISLAGAVIVAGILLGLVYLFPISMVILAVRRWKGNKVPRMRGVIPFVALWIVGVLLVVVGTLGMTPGTDVIGVAGLGALTLGTAFLSALIPSIKIINVAKPKKPERLTKKIIMAEPVPQEENEEKSEK